MLNLILTGFSGTGKTAIGRQAAQLLAWQFVDTDQEVARAAGKPVDRIFAEDGEPAFRRLEAEALAQACRRRNAVIATGGGAIADERNREVMLRSGVVVCLETSPETIHQRLFESQEGSTDPTLRPLLAGPDPLGQIRQLKERRQPAYALAHWTVHTDDLTPEEAAQEVVRAWDLLQSPLSANLVPKDDTLAGVVYSQAGACPIYVGWGLLEHTGEFCQRAGLTSVAYCFSDESVFFRYGRRAQVALEAAGIPAHSFSIQPGEPSKSLESAAQGYRFLAEQRAERGHFIVAIGGGVVGDLAGFVAATFNRGMPFIQVPTTLAAMVDASIGGKTAVNLPQGKNLVGAFHQPRLTLSDLGTLTSLPRRELTSGWAEAIKHGLILDADLFHTFEEHPQELQALDPSVLPGVLRRSIAVKVNLVNQDERETLGIRTLLNYGHTVGHALEAATEYGTFLHGEAVSIGMTAAAHISHGLGLLSDQALKRQTRLLESFGLPTRCRGVDLEAVKGAMEVDKKTTRGAIRWVLLEEIGKAVMRNDVPPSLVDRVLEELTR